MITVFLFALFSGAFLIVHKKGRGILCNDLFYLSLFWLLIFGIYLLSGVKYGNYGFSWILIIYLIACFLSYYKGRKNGLISQVKIFNTDKHDIPSNLYFLVGILGVVLFMYDVIRLNSVLFMFNASEKNDIELSMIGTIGVLLVPILLVEGLHLFISDWLRFNKINLLSLFLLFLYTIPCIVHSGRESILYVGICLLSLFGYKSLLPKNKIQESKSIIYYTTGLLVLCCLAYLIFMISTTRFDENAINSFLFNNDVPDHIINEAYSWGSFDFLFYNIISYFGHQIPFLDFTIREYNGPFMFGMFELNIISRRLPDFIGLDYKMVSVSLSKLYTGSIDFSGSWNTILGSLSFDFSPIGSVFMCYFIGYAVGKLRRKFILTLDGRYAVLTSICCMCCFTSVMLGPFFNTLVYGSIIWWFVFYRKSECIKYNKL